jgi:hypothetical protein
VPDRDPEHWLYRLGAAEWLAAARTELQRSRLALRAKQHRPGLAHARRAAGMALNAMLVVHFDDRYGRSYMDHVNALGADQTAPAPVRAAARALREVSMQAPSVVTLGARGSEALADAAEVVVAHVASLIAAQPS